MDPFDLLNSIYQPLCDKAAELGRGLKETGYQAAVHFHNNHSIKRNDGFATAYYPIPAISVKKLGDIGVDTDCVWFEATLPKEEAMNLDYASIASRYRMEVYGSENFLCDLYHEQMDALRIIGSITSSLETNICVLLYFHKDVTCDELMEAMRVGQILP